MMKRLIACASIVFGLLAASVAPSLAASLVAKVSISNQTMTVIHQGKEKYHWKISTARAGKVTPQGEWTAKQFKRFHRSSRYYNAPMPYSIFYNGNFAIHGTNQLSKLGSPASAGCIRLSKANAAKLFRLAKRAGRSNTLVVVEH